MAEGTQTKKQAAENADTVLMTNQLQDLLEREEFTKALKYSSQRKYLTLVHWIWVTILSRVFFRFA